MDAMDTRTANPAFDAYCRQDFLDNVLRGGMPIHLGEKEIFYVYARKHGDMERDYNYFRLLPEFYSQGNGNFRDINQNRRCDVAFFPQVGDKNIHMFYDFIQLDGYNPLGVEKTTYSLPEERVGEAAQILGIREEEAKQLTHPYTPGMVASLLESRGDYGEKELTEMIGSIVDMSESLVTSDFLEGYWCDHWTYNLDLIENYCSIYPEREHQLLYEDGSYVYMKPGAGVYPRKQRYVETEEGIRQYHAVYSIKYKGNEGKRLTDTKGRILHTTLLSKSVTVKFSKPSYEALRLRARKANRKLAEYIRESALNGEVVSGHNTETVAIAKNLIGMANNLNQLTKLSHQRGFHETHVYVVDLLRRLKAILGEYRQANPKSKPCRMTADTMISHVCTCPIATRANMAL